MRVSNAAPELAEEQAKAALDAANGGVLETANETVGEYGIRNPLGGVAGWSEVYMNANLESFLKGYNDPLSNHTSIPRKTAETKTTTLSRKWPA